MVIDLRLSLSVLKAIHLPMSVWTSFKSWLQSVLSQVHLKHVDKTVLTQKDPSVWQLTLGDNRLSKSQNHYTIHPRGCPLQ
jgi:hypothetical protein